MAKLVVATLAPHVKPGTPLDANDHMLFPDDAHELPGDVEAQERAWMLKLNRSGG